MSLAAATIVARPLLSYARVLAASFREYHPDVPFLVLLADEVDGRFDPAAQPFELVRFRDIRTPRRLRARYAQQPLSYAATPFFLAHLLDRGFTRVLFLKQESLVLGELTPVFEMLGAHPIALTPHLLEPPEVDHVMGRELNILQSGIFNVGLLGVAASPIARRFLDWWSDRVGAHCLHDVGRGMHYEQRWLDLVPSYFPEARIIRDPRFNVGHWNLPERDAVDDVRLFRFSGFDPEQPRSVTRYATRHDAASMRCGALFERYARLLMDAGYRRWWP